jgi:tartrate dehydrogenase/decarboxylase/D-malate dehydrogenase
MAPPDFLDQLATYHAMLLGAVGHPEVQDHLTLNGLLLPIRRRFDQCVCLRPAYLYAGVESPLRNKAPGSIDMLVFRENTEGEYANIGGRLYQHTEHDVAIQTSVFTRRGCERIIRAAFEQAILRPRRRVASITKSNAQGFGMVLWDEVFAHVARDYPQIETESLLVDRAVMEFVRRPESFDVVVASNLFGDILTDLSAIIVGSMGLAASGNLDPTRQHPSLFEPVHGSAPDIAGKGIANPLAAILSAAMMLSHLGLDAAARLVHRGVSELLQSHGPRTPDLGGAATTDQVGQAVLELVTQLPV